jgi:hypothetical protein
LKRRKELKAEKILLYLTSLVFLAFDFESLEAALRALRLKRTKSTAKS